MSPTLTLLLVICALAGVGAVLAVLVGFLVAMCRAAGQPTRSPSPSPSPTPDDGKRYVVGGDGQIFDTPASNPAGLTWQQAVETALGVLAEHRAVHR